MSEPLYLQVTPKLNLEPCGGCNQCSLRCANDVPFSQNEWAHVVQYLTNLNETERELVRRVEIQDKTVDLGDSVQVEMCRFFNMQNDHCMIYPVRPLMCRFMGHVEWMPCPINLVQRTIPTSEALQVMEAYAREDRRESSGWLQGKE